jgi:hypothetical protein
MVPFMPAAQVGEGAGRGGQDGAGQQGGERESVAAGHRQTVAARPNAG